MGYCMKISTKMAVGVASLALLAGFSFAQEEEVLAKYGSITIKKVTVDVFGQAEENRVAVIDDSSDEVPVIPENVSVDSVYYSRAFKTGVPSTLMLPLEVNTWQLGVSAFEFVEVVKDCTPQCKYRVNVRTVYADKIRANTPYVVVAEDGHSNISFNKRHQVSEYVLNTTTNGKSTSYTMGGLDWNFIGTYERIDFTNPSGIYGFAAKEKNGVKMGDFKKAGCSENGCAFVRPFRGYLKCSMSPAAQSKPVLAKSAADESASLVDLPEIMEVHVIDDTSTTYLGRVNTMTGEFVNEDNRWFDTKGRALNRKPTAKGAYYGKPVIR